jgi:hypothetical protein
MPARNTRSRRGGRLDGRMPLHVSDEASSKSGRRAFPPGKVPRQESNLRTRFRKRGAEGLFAGKKRLKARCGPRCVPASRLRARINRDSARPFCKSPTGRSRTITAATRIARALSSVLSSIALTQTAMNGRARARPGRHALPRTASLQRSGALTGVHRDPRSCSQELAASLERVDGDEPPSRRHQGQSSRNADDREH